VCAAGFACQTFAVWVDTGRVRGDEARAPRRSVFDRMFAAQ
jgi:hypothetical protein